MSSMKLIFKEYKSSWWNKKVSFYFMVVAFLFGVISIAYPPNVLIERPLLLKLFEQIFALSFSYFLPLLILSVSSPSRFGTMVATYFDIIFFVLAIASLFSWLR